MLKKLIFISSLMLLCVFGRVWADSNGMLLNDDSIGGHYIDVSIKELYSRKYIQDYSLLISNESDPRNILISGGYEILDYVRKLRNKAFLRPKIGIFMADFLDQTALGLGIGGVYHLPKSEKRKYDTIAEVILAPRITSFIDGTHMLAFRAQINYPLPQNTEFNFGYRNIAIGIEKRSEKSFEQGLYIGLTTYF